MSGCAGNSGDGCGCSCGGARLQAREFEVMDEAVAAMLAVPPPVEADEPVARVNGIALHAPGQRPEEAALRQRAYSELLRQAALGAGLLDAADVPQLDGSMSAAASLAIEALLERALQLPVIDEAACRRHHAAQPRRFGGPERVALRHVLFAVTPGVDLNALRKRAEALLLELRCASAQDGAFGKAAAELSNCPSGAHGGALGELTAADVVPELGKEIFGHAEVGVLPRLVHSRHGLHVVEVLKRELGDPPPFEQVHAAVAQSMRQHAWVLALRQYLQRLAGTAELAHVSLDGADTPLVQ
ncbi:peptidylprolyl isomerase [Azohydromonas lata]|uniref:peptidylprolyl isomerase n=1 Tax=Azohydromonas lata TaxID=45677 RepID=UPI0009FC9047